MNWREHLRIIAMVANVIFVLLLSGSKGWALSLGFGVPMIAYPAVALLALAVNANRRAGDMAQQKMQEKP